MGWVDYTLKGPDWYRAYQTQVATFCTIFLLVGWVWVRVRAQVRPNYKVQARGRKSWLCLGSHVERKIREASYMVCLGGKKNEEGSYCDFDEEEAVGCV